MKKVYEKPYAAPICISGADILSTSGDPDWELPVIPGEDNF